MATHEDRKYTFLSVLRGLIWDPLNKGKESEKKAARKKRNQTSGEWSNPRKTSLS